MKRRILLALPFALAVAACKPQQAAAPAQDESSPAYAASANAAAATGAAAKARIEAESGAGMAVAALAGRFGDGESVLELRADGSYVQTLDIGGASISSDGRWAPDGAHAILLDPSSKEAADARFEVVSADVLRGADGKREFKRIAE
jgi:hypothetical protein